jgi:hypothetical protein
MVGTVPLFLHNRSTTSTIKIYKLRRATQTSNQSYDAHTL